MKRPSGSSRARLGPLAGALFLHGVALVLAASFGLRVVQRDESAGTLAIWVAPPPAPIEAVFTPEIAAEPDRAVASALPEVELPELQDPEWLPTDGWAALPPDDSIRPPADVVRPLDLGAFAGPSDLGSLARRGPTGTGASVSGPGATGVAGVGAGSTGGGGTGTGAAPGSGAIRRLPQILDPRPLDVPPPSYPQLSRRAGEQGTVLCRLHLSEQGLVTLVEVVESSGFARLDDAAREALAHWRFQPRSVDGRAVATTLEHRVTFRLDG